MPTAAPRPLLLLLVVLTVVAGAAAVTFGPAAAANPAAEPGSHALRGTGIGAPLGSAPDSDCFGAAARDPQRPCRDPKLRLTVVPKPDDAVLEPNSACTPFERTKVLLPCAFGASPDDAENTVALVGDSHAAHWRAALDVAAAGRTWRGVSLTHSGCPFSKAVAKLDDPADLKECKAWNKAALGWFTKHPEVTTVFVSQHTGGKVVVPSGSTNEKTQIAGYQAVWKALPKTVTRIFVIRDTPRNTGRTAGCVTRAMKAKKPAGPACAVPYATAQDADPSVAAAKQYGGSRVKVIDLTSFMCSKRLCLPVIGGALVHKDNDHLTQTFSTTLGPYLLRAINRHGVPAPPAAEE
ncbi:O-antigen acetylase [Paraconexibacter sp. AEG42_29]|uniref:O-antigen acetylase n=1 Tax=Paraconexibacter sp. AEG42_29 TaxID=2997339 RepID=A0AAU7B0V3_9ACTN